MNREATGGNKAETDCFAMQEATIASCGLDPMPDRVTEIQKRTHSLGFEFVFGDNGGLDSHIPSNERGQVIELIEHRAISDGRMLDDLRKALIEFPLRER